MAFFAKLNSSYRLNELLIEPSMESRLLSYTTTLGLVSYTTTIRFGFIHFSRRKHFNLLFSLILHSHLIEVCEIVYELDVLVFLFPLVCILFSFFFSVSFS